MSQPDDLEAQVLSATPYQLVCLLYDGALKAIAEAQAAAAEGNAERRTERVGKAVDIIANGLKANLDMAAGELSERLAGLYDYLVSILLRANLKNDASLLAEAERLLTDLADAWRQIDPEMAG
jgi:flagellar protein FliS